MNKQAVARELVAVAKELTAGGIKRWLEDISTEMGLEGEITKAVIKEGEKRLKKIKVKKGSERTARTPQVGDEIRYVGPDGAVTLDEVYDVFGNNVETKYEEVFKKNRLRWRGRFWQASEGRDQTAAHGDEAVLHPKQGEVILKGKFDPPRGADEDAISESEELNDTIQDLKRRAKKIPALRGFRVKKEHYLYQGGRWYGLIVLKGRPFDDEGMAQAMQEDWNGIITASSKTRTARYSMYEDIITGCLKRIGRKDIDPRHVEAYLRMDFSTLDGLTRARFLKETKEIVQAIDADPRGAERLAKSYAL